MSIANTTSYFIIVLRVLKDLFDTFLNYRSNLLMVYV